MKSPFPGMDPYLETYWGDVHTSLVTYARDQLSGQMPADLRVRVEEHVTLQLVDDQNGQTRPAPGYYPDVRVVEQPGGGSPQPAAPGGVALAEPLVVPLAVESETQRSIRILDTRSGNRVVTAIEILSPTNKTGRAGRVAYRQKQEDLLNGEVSLVEIDLLRAGDYVMAAAAHLVPPPYQAPYRICVVRAWRPLQAEVYRVSLRERLPIIRIPLRESDPDARLDLQELIDKGYENAGYGGSIDYRADPQPPLQGEDAVWADALLREKSMR